MSVTRSMTEASTHVHAWELRAVEFDSWGQVRFYECATCAGVRYV